MKWPLHCARAYGYKREKDKDGEWRFVRWLEDFYAGRIVEVNHDAPASTTLGMGRAAFAHGTPRHPR